MVVGSILLNGCPKQTEVTEEKGSEENISKEEMRQDAWLAQQIAFEEKRKEGVNFIAFGPDQEWTAEIDADRLFRFQDGKEISLVSAGPTSGVRPADLNAIVYRASSGNASITLSAYPDTCTDLGTGAQFPYKVTGTHRSASGEISSYMGCGIFLTDPALHDIYVLRSWSAYGDLRQEFKEQAPQIEFNFRTNMIYGFDGRCEIFGKFEPMGDRVYIYELDFQDKACRSDDRSPFFDQLNIKEHSISLQDGTLTMTNDRDVLTFVKVD